MMALTDELAEICTAIRRHRYFWANEYELQDSLEKVLAKTGLDVIREHNLPGTGRLDFYVERIAVEVKINGSLANVIRQLGRYAKSDDVDGIVLVTTIARHMTVPAEIFGKPVHVAALFGDLL